MEGVADVNEHCIGYGPNGEAFACPNEAGTPWTPLWCMKCDMKRRERIGRQLRELSVAMAKRAAARREGGET